MINYSILFIFIFMHFTIFKVIGYEVTFLNLLVYYWLYSNYKINLQFDTKLITTFSILLVIPLINIELNLEFIKTYATYIQAILIIFLVLNYNLKETINYQKIYKTIVFLQGLILTYALFQILLYKFFGETLLYNPWGIFQFHHIYNPNGHAEARAVGFFLEPSFLALISLVLFFTRFILEEKLKLTNIFITFGVIFLAQSMFGFVVLLSLVLYIIFSNLKTSNKYFFMIFSIILFLTVIGNIELYRLNEFSDTHSSGYWRLIAPIVFFKNHLYELISGFPFGSIEDNFRNYFVFRGRGWHGTGLDNGIYVYIYYFGILSILYFLYILSIFIKTRNINLKIFIIFYLLMLNANGAIFSIDVVFSLIIFPIYILKVSEVMNLKEKEVYVNN